MLYLNFKKFLSIFSCILLRILVADSRKGPAKSAICERLPTLRSLCSSGDPPPSPEVARAFPAPPLPSPPPSPPPVAAQSGLSKSEYCGRYSNHFEYFCSSPKEISERKRVADFCASYGPLCPEPQIPDQVIVQLCLEKAPLAREFCKGKEKGRLIEQCDLWYKYCVNDPRVNPTAFNDPFISAICASYQTMGDAYCPGYESATLRQYCNYYRVYCQGKKPFPNVDGSIGLVLNNWGIGGIPFYPFNPQGSIAGGERIDVGFGDWGGEYSNRKGVSDFYEQTDQFSANWQRANFGGGTSWDVPIVGIGGYNRYGVTLGGIASFDDLPGMLAGGVAYGPPLSGLAQIPLSENLPVPQTSPGSGINSLSAPVGTGNLGIIGALLTGAPISSGPIGPLAQFGQLGRKKRDVIKSIDIDW